MFNNLIEEIRYISSIVAPNGENLNLHIIRSTVNTEVYNGYIVYEFYLTDRNPDHNVLVGIGRKAFTPEEYDTEEERLEALSPLINDAIENGYKKALLVISYMDNI